MQHANEMLRCLMDCDVEQLRKLDRHLMSQFAQHTDAELLTTIHLARTVCNSIPFRQRAYSHRWLLERHYPSQLPDALKPKAERIYPRIVGCVGIASHSSPGRKGAFNRAVEQVMADAVLETYADGHANEPQIVKARMMEKRAQFKRGA
jgi:hypothetical protein